MLGRKNYTQEELDHAKKAIDQQLSAYKKLVKVVEGSSDPKAKAALESFEPLFATNMALVLDRYFVHRLRMGTGKDTNPLNELELMVDALITNDGVLRENKVIKFDPEQSVVKLKIGDRVKLTAEEFERLSKAFFTDLAAKFL
jgi:hypothetical protein